LTALRKLRVNYSKGATPTVKKVHWPFKGLKGASTFRRRIEMKEAAN
jgi:hypothetical protein